MVYFSLVCLLKLILYNSKPQNQMCDWNQKCFCFVLKKSFLHEPTHLTLRFLYILGWSGPRCGAAAALQQARCNSRRLATTAAAALLLCHMSATAAAPLAGFDSFALYPILACLEKMSCILQQYFQWKTSSSSSSSFDSSFYYRIPYYLTLVQLYKAALRII